MYTQRVPTVGLSWL